MRSKLLFAALAGLTFIASEPANAITITFFSDDPVSVPTTTLGSQTVHFTAGPTTVDYPNTSQDGVYRSPWQGTPFENLAYTSVRGGTAGYNMTGTGLNLFWGSPDTYNTLTLWTGLNGTGDSVQLTGGVLSGPLGLGHHLVQILTDVTFRSITLSSTSPAFEFANLAATPLPGALPLFLTGLGAVGWLFRRRARRQLADSVGA